MVLLLRIFVTFFFIFYVARAQNEQFENKTFISKNFDLNYRYFKPKNKEERLPLVLFLHGAGERGMDNEKNLKYISHLASDDFQKDFPCYVLVPQCPTGMKWVNVEWTLKSHRIPVISSPLKATLELIHKIIQVDKIDTQRIYVVGLSMGGFGVWDILCREPGLFAAAIPICGGGDENQANLIKDIPIWAFHGGKDKVVLPSRSENMVQAIQKLNGQAKITIYPEQGHNVWEMVLNNREVWSWLFQQTKKL